MSAINSILDIYLGGKKPIGKYKGCMKRSNGNVNHSELMLFLQAESLDLSHLTIFSKGKEIDGQSPFSRSPDSSPG